MQDEIETKEKELMEYLKLNQDLKMELENFEKKKQEEKLQINKILKQIFYKLSEKQQQVADVISVFDAFMKL